MDLIEAKQNHGHRHFWELSRADSVLSEVKSSLHDKRCLDFGAGDLFLAEHIHSICGQRVYAFDPFAKYNIHNSSLVATNQWVEIEQAAPFDRIFLLDVLEHVEQESTLLQQLKTFLKQDGQLVITVPAFQFLFSDHDIFLRHFRRYRKPELQKVLTENGFTVERIHYFYFSLFLGRGLERTLAQIFPKKEKKQEGIGGWAFAETHPITRVLRIILNCDFFFCKTLSHLGITLPGLSVFAICKKNSA